MNRYSQAGKKAHAGHVVKRLMSMGMQSCENAHDRHGRCKHLKTVARLTKYS